MKKDVLVVAFILLAGLFSLSFATAADITSLATATHQGDCGGDKWGASCDLAVISDGNQNTFYGMPSTNKHTFEYDFSESKSVNSVSVIWQPSPNNITPGDYSFSYWDGNQWITPNEWISSSSQQGFATEYTFTLSAPVTTTKLQLTRSTNGAAMAIGLAEFHVFGDSSSVQPPTNINSSLNQSNIVNNGPVPGSGTGGGRDGAGAGTGGGGSGRRGSGNGMGGGPGSGTGGGQSRLNSNGIDVNKLVSINSVNKTIAKIEVNQSEPIRLSSNKSNSPVTGAVTGTDSSKVSTWLVIPILIAVVGVFYFFIWKKRVVPPMQ